MLLTMLLLALHGISAAAFLLLLFLLVIIVFIFYSILNNNISPGLRNAWGVWITSTHRVEVLHLPIFLIVNIVIILVILINPPAAPVN
jgi:hypothetical protein